MKRRVVISYGALTAVELVTLGTAFILTCVFTFATIMGAR